MVEIRPQDLNFKNFKDFTQFLREKLNWQLKEEASKDALTYEFLPEELRIEEKQLRNIKDDTIYQFKPFVKDQPWGIFLIELSDSRVYKTFLRQILRGLVSTRKRSSTMPVWELENLLFICTYNYENFTFAHFKGEKYHNAKLSIFGWGPEETGFRTLLEFNLPPLYYKEEFKDDSNKWLEQWSKAFDKEKLTTEFFESYKYALKFIKDKLTAQNKADYQKVHSYAQQLLSRIMFLYFVAKK